MAQAAIDGGGVQAIELRRVARVPSGGLGARVHPLEVPRLVAALARCERSADRYMGRRDARRVHVVVTGGAAAGYPDVIEHRAAPAERRMAGVALQVGDDVRGPLALRLHAVVAGRAAAAHLGVVEVDRRVPGDGRMAAGALVGREDVVGGLGGGAHDGADAVTGAAILRGALE